MLTYAVCARAASVFVPLYFCTSKASKVSISASPASAPYVSIRQHTSAWRMLAYAGAVTASTSIRQHTSAYASIRQHTSAYTCEASSLASPPAIQSESYALVLVRSVCTSKACKERAFVPVKHVKRERTSASPPAIQSESYALVLLRTVCTSKASKERAYLCLSASVFVLLYQ
jgi:hypothetical protein